MLLYLCLTKLSNIMAAKDNSTEQHIKETAMRVFFKEGRFNATTQEIADAAGVNRTLLHYYFRTREILLDIVLKEGKSAFRTNLAETVDPALSFKEKISRLIDVWMEHILEFPYLDAYLVSQMSNTDFLERMKKEEKENSKKTEAFFEELQVEMNAGRIKKMDPTQFLLNFISMVSYPLVMRPLLEASMFKTKRAYNQALEHRKEAILAALFI